MIWGKVNPSKNGIRLYVLMIVGLCDCGGKGKGVGVVMAVVGGRRWQWQVAGGVGAQWWFIFCLLSYPINTDNPCQCKFLNVRGHLY